MSDPFWFWKLRISEKIIFTIFVLVGFFGLKFHFKADIEKKTELLKQELFNICSTDENCKSAVKTHFQQCFNNNFDEDGLGHYQKFAHSEFSECMNNNAEANYFEPIRLDKL